MDKWEQIEKSPAFRTLMQQKKSFIVPATIFFLVYYFLLPIGAGYFKSIMAVKITGAITLGYAFALSQFFMAWILAYLYVRAANRFDDMAGKIRSEIQSARAGRTARAAAK